MPAFGPKMSWYADASPLSVPGEDIWHYLVKREADEDGGGEEKKEGFVDKIKHAPGTIKKELDKDVKLITEKTHIPTW